MGFWSWLTTEPSGNTDSPGDPDGVEVNITPQETRSLPKLLPSPWAGWPAEWGVPDWDFGSKYNELVDIAWNCLDLNSRVLASMPVYRTRGTDVVDPLSWMINPDPLIYSSWHEFCKQLFWDYLLGEAFVLSMVRFSDGFPMTFRVIPPWMMNVEMRGGSRVYHLGGITGPDVTEDILHIRYKSTTDGARGVGPLESAGGRMLTAGVLAKYVREIVSTGGISDQTLESVAPVTEAEAQDALDLYVTSRAQNGPNVPPFLSGITLKTHQRMSPKDMAMIEVAQFTEGRIADLLGVPRALVGLPTGDSFTYSNVSSWFDHHDRAMLRPVAVQVMSALSNWALPRGQAAELNRDEYSRPSFNERADAWVKLKDAGIVSADEVRTAERLRGDAPTTAPAALTGGEQ